MSAKWNNGLELTSQNKAFKIHVGGRTQIDTVYWQNRDSFNTTGGATDQDAVNVRRGRLRVDGTIYEIIDFAAEYDFVNEFNVNRGPLRLRATTQQFRLSPTCGSISRKSPSLATSRSAASKTRSAWST